MTSLTLFCTALYQNLTKITHTPAPTTHNPSLNELQKKDLALQKEIDTIETAYQELTSKINSTEESGIKEIKDAVESALTRITSKLKFLIKYDEKFAQTYPDDYQKYKKHLEQTINDYQQK